MNRIIIITLLLLSQLIYSQTETSNYIYDEDSLLSPSQEIRISNIIEDDFIQQNILVQLILSSNYYPFSDPITFGKTFLEKNLKKYKESILILISKDLKKTEIIALNDKVFDSKRLNEIKKDVLIPKLGKEDYFKGIKAVLKKLK